MTEPIDHDRDHAFAELLAARPCRARPDLPAQARRRGVRGRAAGESCSPSSPTTPSRRRTSSPPAWSSPAATCAGSWSRSPGRGRRRRVIAGAFAAALPDIHARARPRRRGDLRRRPGGRVRRRGRSPPTRASWPSRSTGSPTRSTTWACPILPRLLAEVAHTRTGIDIHPGATHRALASASTTAPASSSARPPSSATTSSSTRASRSARSRSPRARPARSATPPSATASSSTPTPRSSAATPSSATTASSAATSS